MTKNCKCCNTVFTDATKNKNRVICSRADCRKFQRVLYAKTRSKAVYHKAIAKFKTNNPNYIKEWRFKNKERDRELNRLYKSKRYSTDINFRIAVNLRNRLRIAIKNNSKVGSAVRDLSCSIEQLKKHLESKFQFGMSWDNYGKWHIDHVVALNNFDLSDYSQLKVACNYNNLQPLWAFDNRSKGDKYVSV